jgi:hypothetical protein
MLCTTTLWQTLIKTFVLFGEQLPFRAGVDHGRGAALHDDGGEQVLKVTRSM